MKIEPKTSAVLIVDLQNDFLHPEGAYGRAKQTNPEIAALPERILPLLNSVRAAGGWIVSTQFTLVPGKNGEPFIASHLKKLRPFLKKGDFLPASWGNSLVDLLQPADLVVEKVAYSAFYQTRMEFALSRAEIKTLFVCGIVTNGGVASTARNAHVLGFDTTILSDGCAAFSTETHKNAILDLSTVSDVKTCAEIMAMFQ